ncbi:MAG: tRNA (5-methylaminomethyl-2-thiouridine)(34)-methyltransferase MnmD [Pseudomonadales bacterium]|nr:tRNA (5-methylaminomethyl-2-thiouridine)(34)-methyltransferase MnmD [Pseudomonadales bacterium]
MTITPADLAWKDADTPFNTRFQDIYFSTDAQAEVHRVFLEPAGLPTRVNREPRLTVAEFGFGSGLNFIVLATLARQAGCRLHFLSAELNPFRRTDLARTRGRYTDSAQRAMFDELVTNYPPLLPGWHRRSLGNGAITVSLFFGDVRDFVTELAARHAYGVDAWLLDGFAPDRNPRMWEDDLFPTMAATSRNAATVTTFTSAGRVRRGLEQAGFAMRRVDQRPIKRESLAGVCENQSPRPVPPSCVQVLGGGIAGCSVAAHLALQGIAVRLVEPMGQLATHASSMRAAQHARLLADGSVQAGWRAASHLYSLAFTRGRQGLRSGGAVQLPGPNATVDKLERIARTYADSGDWLAWADARTIGGLTGWPTRHSQPGLYFPDAPAVDLKLLSCDLASTPGITIEYGAGADPALPTVYAFAHGAIRHPQFGHYRLHALWGQLETVTMSTPPALPVLGDGYLLPWDDCVMVGSTYEYTPWRPEAATTHNLAKLAGLDFTWRGRQRAARLTTPDRMPLVGSLGEQWVSLAHGSMGATSAHLAGALVQSSIMGWIAPVSVDVAGSVDPARFGRRQQHRQHSR